MAPYGDRDSFGGVSPKLQFNGAIAKQATQEVNKGLEEAC